MRIIDCTPAQPEESSMQRLLSQVQETLQPGDVELEAQEALISRLDRGLDQRFTLLRNIQLQGLKSPVPLVLVGPAGMLMLNVNGREGVYRAKEDSWWEVNQRTQEYQPAQLNLIKQTQQYAQAVTGYLAQQGQLHPEIVPVLAFSHPGVHVDSSRPAVRILLSDGVERLAMGLLQSNNILNAVDAKNIVDALEKTKELKVEEAVPEPAPEPKPAKPQAVEEAELRLNKAMGSLNLPPAFRFQKKQWILLGVMAGMTAVILLIFIFLIIFTA